MALHDFGLLEFEEPFKTFRAHGLIIKDGAKMSKSRGNVVNPDKYLEQYGADVFRTYMMFLGPYEDGGDFRDEGITGVQRFLESVWRLVRDHQAAAISSETVLRATHRTIKKVQEDIEALRYNTAIAGLMTLLNVIRREGPPSRWVLDSLVIMLAPFAPHIAEEMWERLSDDPSSRTIFEARWPPYDPRMTLDEIVELVIQVNGKVRGRISVAHDAEEAAIVAAALAAPGVRAHLDGRAIRKQVVVPRRLGSFVV
jgi:leucyl-tRNA synthetase